MTVRLAHAHERESLPSSVLRPVCWDALTPPCTHSQQGVDTDNINATLERGVLTVSVPKVETEKPAPKKIAIIAA